MEFAERAPGRTIEIEGEQFLFFSGTSYLGMAHNEPFRKYLLDGLDIYGTNYGSSRNSNFQFKIFEEAEEKLASLAGADSALTVSSGYLAGQLVAGIYKKRADFFYAPNTHPALSLNNENCYSGKFDLWTQKIADKVSVSKMQEVVIFANSLDPLFCERFSFDWIFELPRDKKISVVIDDSHGFGITGINGGGIFSLLKIPDNVNFIVTASLGKALGIPGGVVFSNNKINTSLKNEPLFIGSSPLNPAYLFAYLKAEKEYIKARENLALNFQSFHNIISPISFLKYFDQLPVFFVENKLLYQYLIKKKIFISHFPYPAPENDPISRIVISSLHTEEDLKFLGDSILEFNQDFRKS
ncbi:glycine C-acetyltransferase [soil metagenome]